IRYRTGDYVRLAEAPSTHSSPASEGQSVLGGRESRTPDLLEPQGPSSLEYPWPAAVDVAGREQEFLISATGRRISLTAFNMHDAVFDDLYAVQFYQDQQGIAEFRYVVGPRFHSSRLAGVEERVRRKLGDDFQLT